MENDSQNLMIPVSAGELIDKITILRLKSERLQLPSAVSNVRRELEALEAVLSKNGGMLCSTSIVELRDKLQIINTKLWDVEDNLRLMEKRMQFNEEFIAQARSVYLLNDERKTKRQINKTGSI